MGFVLRVQPVSYTHLDVYKRQTVDSAETDQRLDLLHRNILKYGTISHTLSGAVPLEGTLTRKV